MLVVIGAILAGYMMEHGELMVLLQPAELVIIAGSSLGTILIANPMPTVIRLFKGITGILSNGPDRAAYLESLKMLNELFGK